MNRISREYAVALFSLAQEKHQETAWGEALAVIREQFDSQPEYAALLNAPNIPAAEREALIDRAFSALPEEVLSFLKILSARGLVFEFGECVREYKKLTDELLKVSTARVVSAAALTDAEKRKLKDRLEKVTGRSVEMELRVDPSLLGGVVVYVDGKIIDGSLRSRLRQVKDVISG